MKSRDWDEITVLSQNSERSCSAPIWAECSEDSRFRTLLSPLRIVLATMKLLVQLGIPPLLYHLGALLGILHRLSWVCRDALSYLGLADGWGRGSRYPGSISTSCSPHCKRRTERAASRLPASTPHRPTRAKSGSPHRCLVPGIPVASSEYWKRLRLLRAF